MARRKIIWTVKAQLERMQILEYWVERNKSKAYSIKLNKLIKETLQLLVLCPDIGKPSNFSEVRVKTVSNYLIFYKYNEQELVVMSVWDTRRDNNKFSIE